MTLWNNRSAADATGAAQQGGAWQAARVIIDSRTARPGDLFVAIKGENFDGHQFVAQALAAGAVAAIVSRVPDDVPANANLIVVEDPFAALENLARAARARSRARIVGVTGSVGKTSTKEMLRLGLAAHGATYATLGNLNNHIGTPLNLANLPEDAQFAVFEMGMNHSGEIESLTKLVRPHVAVISNVEAVHLEFFESEAGIASAKAEIFLGMEKGSTAVLNADNRHFAQLAKAAEARGLQVVACGSADGNPCQLLDYKTTRSGCTISASIFGKPSYYTLAAVGRHWAMTSLMTLAVAHALSLNVNATAHALENFQEPQGRGRLMRLPLAEGECTLIDDSYNASPAAMRAAFAKTAEVWEAGGKKGRKVAALGNMLELGDTAAQMHAALAGDLEAHGFDAVFTAGELMAHLHNALPAHLRAGHVAQSAELAPLLANYLRAGDCLLVKGSHGSKIYLLAESLPQLFKEKKHAV